MHLKEARLHELIGMRGTSFLSQLSTSGGKVIGDGNGKGKIRTVTRVAAERLTGMNDAKRKV